MRITTEKIKRTEPPRLPFLPLNYAPPMRAKAIESRVIRVLTIGFISLNNFRQLNDPMCPVNGILYSYFTSPSCKSNL